MDEKPIEKAFCILPWIHSFVNSDGNYQVCCTSEEHHRAIKANDGKYFNIKDKPSLDEVMNSEFMKKVRRDMMEGKWNPVCARCLVTELDNGVSRRMIENKNYDHVIVESVLQTKPDGTIPVKFKSIDYRLGNLCNLQCRMCGPHSSTAWLKEWNNVKIDNEMMTPERRKELESFDWIEKDHLFQEFKQKLEHAEHLHFAGGEPLITPQMARMLKYCIDSGYAKNITLTYNTNLTKLPENILELWRGFKAVRLLCSVDGFGPVNDYIRHPSKWDVLDRNLTFLDQNAEKYQLEEILLSCTVQIYNVLDLPNLFAYLKKFKKVVPAANLINLHIPSYLQSSVLPDEIKVVATERLTKLYDELKDELPERHKYLAENILQVLNFMNQKNTSDQLSLFKRINGNMDNIKGVKMESELPELHQLLKKHTDLF